MGKTIKKLTKEIFVEKSNLIHKNKYSYEKSFPNGWSSKITITCPIHGDFEQFVCSHLRNSGCPKCGIEKQAKTSTYSTKNWIKKAIEKHGNKYNYDKSEYIGSQEKITITCPIHGDFEQRANIHLWGQDCPKCAINNIAFNNKYSLNEWIKKAIEKHGNKYSYDRTIYEHSEKKLIITCPIHGDFEQTAYAHLLGSGCPKCIGNISSQELEIQKFISSLNIDFQISNRTILSGKELDIFIPSKNVAIEFNGLYWHNELHKSNNYHLQKTKECQEKGIRLIHIFEDEWIIKQGIVKSRLSNILGVTQFHTYARKCTLRNISSSEAKLFLDKHHIQGYCNSSIQIGLFQKDKLLAVMTFGSLRKNLGNSAIEGHYELLRFANFQNLNIVGGASKLLKYFINNYSPKEIISYCDLRWSTGNLYEKLGFTFSHQSPPNYFYVFDKERKNRFGFRKDILIFKYGCSPEDTERNFCLSKEWYRIYDCGTKVYKLIIE